MQYRYPPHIRYRYTRCLLPIVIPLCFVLVFLTSCAGGMLAKKSSTSAPPQVLSFPLSGSVDVTTLDPAHEADASSAMVMRMLYSGLVREDKDFRVLPDQATWHISADQKVYTFSLKPSLTFSDGTPLTAQAYVYAWTRALSPSNESEKSLALLSVISGASAVHDGTVQKLTGVRALNDHTLQVTLNQPTPYFLSLLANPLFFPINQKLVDKYDVHNWSPEEDVNGLGAGPFLLKEWQHNFKMVFTPNDHYYGPKSSLTSVTTYFVNDSRVAYKKQSVGQYDMMWNISPSDLSAARGSSSFHQVPSLQTDALFFDTTTAPFNSIEVRQAFAYTLDKKALAHTTLNDAVIPATTIIPPGMPGYQAADHGFSLNVETGQSLMKTVYPDVSDISPITFSYPSSLIPNEEAVSLQQMWQQSLGVHVDLNAMAPDAYKQELADHHIQLGIVPLKADFADPEALLPRFLSNSTQNIGQWHNDKYDALLQQARNASGAQRLALYQQAEQVLLSDAGVVPLDHPLVTGIIPAWIRGIELSSVGLYTGDWSGVTILHH